MTPLSVLYYLLISHALCDFALQTDSMAKGKNRHNTVVPPLGQKFVPCWQYWLTAHSLIHAGGVSLITGSISAGIFEAVTHWIIDFIKCDNWTNPHIDQGLHLIVIILIAIIWSN